MSDDVKLADAGTTATETTGAADKAASAVSGTIASGTTAASETGTTAAATADWRDSFAGDDKDFRKRLDRFTDPTTFAKSYRALEQKLSSGEYKQVTPFPDKGTAEQQAAWRKDNGVPDKADAYEVKLPNGVVPGEADKPGLERLAKHAHERNWSKDQYNAVLEAYYREQDAVTSAREEADGTFRQTSEDTLRADWGSDYRRNVNAVHNLLNGAPPEVREQLLSGRTAEGRLIGDNPAILKWLAQTSMDLNPAATVLPVGDATPKGVSDRLGELEKMMRDRSSDYWSGTNADKLQQEYRDLIDTRDRMAQRAA